MTPDYNAFISYRHNPRDTAVAEEIQTRLERFHIPRAIREETGTQKIDRIFRDQNELELTDDLGADLDEALARSDVLICILSPAYKESKWCLHEIEQFLKTHDQSRIFTVLSEGEPPGIFPDILLHKTLVRTNPDGSTEEVTIDTEPLACDYRMDFKRAARLELPRLVSGMLGCEYDDLVLRNERYRQRRLLAAVSAVAVLSLSAVLWLLYSNARINENYRQAQINESRTIASSSLSLLENGQRIDAVRAALSALPSEDNDRPETAEAEYALCRASLAYRLPYQTAETDVIDLTPDITKVLADEAGNRMILLDDTGMIHVIDTGTMLETAVFSLYGTETVRDPILVNGNIISWTDLGVFSYSPEGTLNWSQELRYSSYGRAAASADQSLIAAGDIDAVQIMRADNGEPFLSLRLSNEDPRYYIDRIIWSKDGSRIAVTLHNSGLGDALGILNTEDGSYRSLGPCGSVLDFRFTKDNRLTVLLDNAENHSYSSGKESILYANDFTVRTYEDDAVCFETAVPASVPNYDGSLYPVPYDEDALLVSAGNTLSLLNVSDGTISAQQTFEASLLTVSDVQSSGTSVILKNGDYGTAWLSGNSASTRSLFPEGIEDAAVFPGSRQSDARYAVLHEGNVRWFEPVRDPNLKVYEGKGFLQPADRVLMNDNRLLVLSDSELVLYDRSTKTEISRAVLGDNEVGILLSDKAVGQTAPLLKINTDDGTMRVVSLSLEDLAPVSESPLTVRDYYGENGIFQILEEVTGDSSHLQKNLFLSSLYEGSTNLSVCGGMLYYLSGSDSPLLHAFSLETHSEEVISLQYGSLSPVFDSASANAPSLTIGESGTRGLVLAGDPGTGDVFPALISCTDGSMQVLTDTLSGGSLLFTEWDAGFAVSGRDSVSVYNASGQLQVTIPHSGTSPAAMKYAFGSLYIVTPDGILREYSTSGDLRSELLLSAGLAANTHQTGTVTLKPCENLLAVCTGTAMDLIDPSLHASLPRAVIEERALAYAEDTGTIIVYTYDDSRSDRFFRPAEIPHYSTAELIALSRDELNH